MNTTAKGVIGIAALAAVVAGILAGLQGFKAEEVACEAIDEARASVQAMYDAGVSASVQIFAEERAAAEERLHRCLSAAPVDPCADAQAARDAAVANYNGIKSPADNAPYAELQTYFAKREEAYNAYKTARDALAQCRAANPPKAADVPYEQSDTKACFDAYDASMAATQDKFTQDTQTLRAALNAALAALDAREKACHPPTGGDQFTEIPGGGTSGGSQTDGGTGSAPVEIANCKMLSTEWDSELMRLRARAAAIPGEIQAVQTSIENINKRMSPLRRDLAEVDTWIPPEVTKTQYEGALNALRAERKVAIEQSLEFYKNMLAKRQAEKSALEQELRDVNAQIRARLDKIQKENEARQRAFPTALHLAKPDKCAYYHCHGMLCGKSDPAPNECGHGSTVQTDVDCKQFFNAYLQAAGVY
ncbi:MAG: hypothetical protein HYT30_01805 [Parcubacteria group bacterium]|nr:hypothetical protein [Parcubacteria group bacterium]